MTDWEKLVIRYADGRRICNCRRAYETLITNPNDVNYGHYVCEYGCRANCLNTVDEIGKRVVAEFQLFKMEGSYENRNQEKNRQGR